MTWSKRDHHWHIAEPQQGCVSPAADLPCVPGARLNTFSDWAGTAPASAHSVSSSLIALASKYLCFLAYSIQQCYLPFLFCLNVQLTSQGPASANESSNLLTTLYHEYTQPCSTSLRKTKSKHIVLIHSSNSLVSNPQCCKQFFWPFCIGHHVCSSFLQSLLHSQEKTLCLKEDAIIWERLHDLFANILCDKQWVHLLSFSS